MEHQKLNKDGKKHNTGKDMYHLPEWSGFIGLFKERRDSRDKHWYIVQHYVWVKSTGNSAISSIFFCQVPANKFSGIFLPDWEVLTSCILVKVFKLLISCV